MEAENAADYRIFCEVSRGSRGLEREGGCGRQREGEEKKLKWSETTITAILFLVFCCEGCGYGLFWVCELREGVGGGDGDGDGDGKKRKTTRGNERKRNKVGRNDRKFTRS